MIKINNVEISGWRAAVRGMRNPMESWNKSDSAYCGRCGDSMFIGENDRRLMFNLAEAGSDHAKYRRYINLTMDITAPLYWWKEWDTYKVGTVANSTSTMHKIHSRFLEYDDFSTDHLDFLGKRVLESVILSINDYIATYKQTQDKEDWYSIIQLLPESYNQLRTVQVNYEVLANMYHSRKNHKLDEWRNLCKWIERLPYSEIIAGMDSSYIYDTEAGDIDED